MHGLWLTLLLLGCPQRANTESGNDTVSTEDSGTNDSSTEDSDTDDSDTEDSGTSTTPRDLCGSDCTTCLPMPSPDGNRYCADPVDPYRESCPTDSGFGDDNACCDDDECGEGAQCAAMSWRYCGGPAPMPVNQCLTAECAKSTDCGSGEACIPAGGLGFAVATCVQAGCSADSDCTSGTNGECTLLAAGTCGDDRVFACTYSEDPCRSDADCATGSASVCRLGADGRTECVEEILPP